MGSFFKNIFSSCLGFFLAISCLLLLFMVIGGSIAMQQNSGATDGVLLLDFKDPIPELSDNIATSSFSFDQKAAVGLHDIVKLIKNAQSDSSIKGIVYKADPSTSLRPVSASTIKDALKEFRDSTDKFVYTYADFFDNTSYLLATSSDSIFVNPMGIVDVNGYASMVMFAKGALEKLDVDINVFYAGEFKSATEPLRRKSMSKQSKFQTREYLADNYNLYLQEVSESRNIPVSNITGMINDFDLDNTKAAIASGMIDGLKSWYEVEDMIRTKLGIKEGKTINYVSLGDYSLASHISKGSSKNKIAVVYAEGNVIYGNEERGNINEATYHKVFDKIRKDSRVKAVVLRVNSGGGSAFTSDNIWHEMKKLQSKGIPVIASFGDYAASGGYYIAASADTIVAHPKTLTGSIGVFSVLPSFKRAMENHLGITFDTVKTSPHAIVASPFLDLSSLERTALQEYTDNMYDTFLDRVADGRGVSKATIHEVAQGRVWTGQKAVDKGLVDVLGGLDTAIEIAAERVGVSDDYRVVEYPRIEKEFWEEIIQNINSGSAKIQINSIVNENSNLGKIGKAYKEIFDVLEYNQPMAKLPYVIVE